MAEEQLRGLIATKKYTYNIVREERRPEASEFRVEFFVDQPGRPVSLCVTFDFVVGESVRFRVENGVYYYDINSVDFERVVDRENQQKMRFQLRQ